MSLLKALTDPRYWEEVATQGRNFGQATSNAVASLATAPVDLINMGLGFAGAPVSKTPVGGTEWLKQLGLYADVPQGAAQIAGETLGNVLPVALPAKAPQIAGGLLQALANAQRPAQIGKQRGAIVWHGSPHKFDRFDASKIGTGEGAQAYGHGLYLAENPSVAQSYKTAGVPDNFGSTAERATEALYSAMDKLSDGRVLYGPNRSAITKDELLREVQRSASDVYGSLTPIKQKMADAYGRTEGSLYKVYLPDNAISKMLNWDADIGSQPMEVQKAIAKMRGVSPDLQSQLMKTDPDKFNKTGQQFYKDMNASLFRQGNGSAGRASAALSEQGIPGIRYLDAMSRNGGGTSNYVVFPGNESLLKILSRE